MVVSGGLGFLMGALAYAYVTPKYGINVSSASWMPAGSSNGAFYHGGAFILRPPAYYYEYDISEEDFLAYLSGRFAVNEIHPTEPVYVHRYLIAFIRKEDYSHDEMSGYNEAIGVTVTGGWYYESPATIHGASQFVYDADRQRAFIRISIR